MTNKVQKIKEWISKEQDGLIDAQGNFEYPEHEGAYNILYNLDAYIDSLQEESEPQFKVGDTIRSKHWNTAVHKIISMDDKSYCLDNGGKVNLPSQQLWELVEEPVSEQNLSNVERIRKNWKEEPISEDLEEACEQLSEDARKHKAETSSPFFSQTDYKQGVMDGAKWQKEHLWKPADGDDLPEIDREVIVLIKYNAQRNIHDDEYPTYRVGFGHRPNPNGWNGKNLDTGEVTHYEPKLYDKGGWNAPDIVYWLDIELPKEIEP